ncbi:alpha/beta hydrolase fold domain-containing protein [Phthorimaea operculella]|nr:alpha/beta hydrolase fold domain-containing protein [Phthorimaea operculella]
MANLLSHVGVFLTITCCLQLSSANIITDGFNKIVDGVDNLLFCDLPLALCNAGVQNKVEEVVKAGPNLKEDIAELEKTDFLAKYKEGEKSLEDSTITRLMDKYGLSGLIILRVTTKDGYLIPVYRIRGKGDPVLVVTDIMFSAIDWLTPGRENCLPCQLADQGYDVWILENRGTTKDSQFHDDYNLERDADKYWDFSFDELARYDVADTIDFMLKTTGKPKVKYVGFSQGAASFYALASDRPEYAEKVSVMAALAPIAFLSNTKNPLFRVVGESPDAVEAIRKELGVNKFNPENRLLKSLNKQICGTEELANIVCAKFASALLGLDYAQINAAQAPALAAHFPSDFSTKQVLHYGQLVKSGKFRKYDYGSEQNKAKYGSEQPPDYPLEKISTPVALYYSNANDLTSVYEDVLLLKNKLPNVVEDYVVPYPTWSHSDYVWAKDNQEKLYNKVVELLAKY